MTMQAEFADGRLRLAIEDGVGRLTLNQPNRRNAISAAMWRALPDAVAAIEQDGSVRIVVVAGAGEQAFSAGADIHEFATIYADEASANAYNAAVRRGQAVLRECRVPVIAAIRGSCMGGGLGLALACDLRFCADDAHFAITPAKLGLAYSFADTRQLVAAVGPVRAKDILLSARVLTASEALRIGLVDRMVAAPDLAGSTDTYVRQVTALSPVSVALSKATINAIADGLTQPPPALDAAIADTFASRDFAEGFRAFLEKRPPIFPSWSQHPAND